MQIHPVHQDIRHEEERRFYGETLTLFYSDWLFLKLWNNEEMINCIMVENIVVFWAPSAENEAEKYRMRTPLQPRGRINFEEIYIRMKFVTNYSVSCAFHCISWYVRGAFMVESGV